MKRRKFSDGGETVDDKEVVKTEDYNPRFDRDTYARARRFVESGGEKEESKPVRKATSAPTAKAAAPTPAPTPKEAPAERASDTSKRFPSETPAAKDDGAKSVSERIKESRERARTSTTGTDTRSVSERIRGSKADTEGAPAKRAEIPTSADGPKAPASTGESTSGPSNLDRVLMATGAGAGLTGAAALARLAYNAKRATDTKRAAETTMEAAKAFSAPRVAEVAKDVSKRRFPEKMENVKLKPKKTDETTTSDKSLGRGEAALKALGIGKAKGGTVKKYASGGMVSSASRRADGIATKGKTKCRIV